MARKRTQIDKEEINEIIELYINNKLNGVSYNLSCKGVSDFNKFIANNPNYRRKNKSLFTLYKYNVWAGSYRGEDSYGKVRIKEIKKQNPVTVMEKGYDAEIIDIVQAVYALHNNPEVLIERLTKMFLREKKRNKELIKKIDKVQDELTLMQEQLKLFDVAMTNFIFQTQVPTNSLNDMLRISKEEDSYCYGELAKMFDNGGEQLANLVGQNEKYEVKNDNVISIGNIIEQKGYGDL